MKNLVKLSDRTVLRVPENLAKVLVWSGTHRYFSKSKLKRIIKDKAKADKRKFV